MYICTILWREFHDLYQAFKKFYFVIGGKLLYSVALISSVQLRISHMCMYIYMLSHQTCEASYLSYHSLRVMTESETSRWHPYSCRWFDLIQQLKEGQTFTGDQPPRCGKCEWVKLLSRVPLFATPWTVAHQAPLSMGFSRQEYWSGCRFLLQGIFPTQGLNPGLRHCRQTLSRLSHQGSKDKALPGDWTRRTKNFTALCAVKGKCCVFSGTSDHS